MSTKLKSIPVCLLGCDKRVGGLGLGLIEEIVLTRALLKREKKSYLVVVALSDSVGSISPKDRYLAEYVLRDGGGIQ
ncbi:hypothetical protein HK096_011454, partial [Nowakowskiella sp. JEL0078]